MNYTDKQRDYIVSEYEAEPSRETVDRLALELEKSPKSIIGKLSKEGVYRREVYRTKRGDIPRTKDAIVASIAEYLGTEDLVGLEKAPKLVLQKLESLLEETA